MLIRFAMLVTALWAIVAAPALCAAGVLEHECRCDDGVACDHESDCDVDPCTELILRRDLAGDGPLTSAPSLAAAEFPPVIREIAAPVCTGGPRSRLRTAPAGGVPHPSDHPLLS